MRGRRSDDELFVLATLGVIVPASVAWVSWKIASFMLGAPDSPSNPLTMVLDLTAGDTRWPGTATWVLIPMTTIIIAAAIWWFRPNKHRSFDKSVRQLPTSGLKPYLSGSGPKIGRKLGTYFGVGPWLKMTHEASAVVVGGPGVGKTTSLALPAAVGHAGPLLVTSSKRDIVDGMRLGRSQRGRIWIFDPQAIATPAVAHAPGTEFWWDPLTVAEDLNGARKLAEIWWAMSRPAGAKPDNYFDPMATELVANLLFAAAATNQDVTRVYAWLTAPETFEPVDMAGNNDADLVSGFIANARTLPDKTQAGVFSSALRSVGFLADPTLRPWLTRQTRRPRFDISDFATSDDTLILLSDEDSGSGLPLVTALASSVLTTAAAQASQYPAGRLPTPLLAVLDEAAAVCRWPQLPGLYSYCGFRGVLLVSFFQSWTQIVESYGPEGAEKLWNSASVRLFLGGVGDATFLRRLSSLCGQYDQTYSEGKGTRKREIFDLASLGALPTGRALALLSTARPVFLKTVPWWETNHAELIQRSIDAEMVGS